MKPTISIQEKFRLIADRLETLPAGFGYAINYSTDGASVPVIEVNIETGYDSFLNAQVFETSCFTAEEYDDREFLSCYDTVCRVVERIRAQAGTAIKETDTSNEDNPF